MPNEWRKRLPIWSGRGCQAEIAVARKRVRPRKPFAELHKLTLSSIPLLRRTGANFTVPLISAARALAAPACAPLSERRAFIHESGAHVMWATPLGDEVASIS